MPTMKLPVELTDADRLVIGADLTTVISAIEKVEAEKKEATRGFNHTLKGHKAQQHDLNESLRTGFIDREIEIEERPDYGRGIVETWRLDTNVVVKTRNIDPDERQLKINEALDQARAADGPPQDRPTDEQVLATSPEEAEELRRQRLAAEAKDRERQERILARLGELLAKVNTFEVPSGIVAKVEAETWVSEQEGATAAEATAGLRVKLIAILESREDEIEKLSAEQASDAAGGKKPRALLKAPAGGKKRGKGITVLDEGGNDITPKPDADNSEGDEGLAF